MSSPSLFLLCGVFLQLIARDLLNMRLDALDVAVSVNNLDVVENDSASETASVDESVSRLLLW